MWFTDLLGCHVTLLSLTVPPEWRHLLSDSKNSEGVFSAVAAQSALLVLLVEKVAELVTAKTSLLTIATEINDIFC